EVIRGQTRTQVNWIQTQLVDVDRRRRPRRDRASVRDTIAASRGDVARLDRDLLGPPGARLRERAVFEHDGSTSQHEAVHRDVAHPSGGPGARRLEQIRDVERLVGKPDQVDRGVDQYQLAEPQMTHEQRGDVEPTRELAKLGERWRDIALGHPESV